MLNQDDLHLLTDESFISFCLGRKKQDVAYWEQYLIANPDQQERMNALRKLLLMTAHQAQELEWQEQLLLVKQKIGESYKEQDLATVVNKPYHHFYRRQWAVAAAIIGILFLGGGLWYFLSRSHVPSVIYTSKAGERKSFQLPDGSTVVLNAQSRLYLGEDFNQSNRMVHLDGEAFFDVVHNTGKPFVVLTDKMEVKVLGTSFNIKAYKDDAAYETALIRGSIELKVNKENTKMVLHPKDKYVLLNNDQLENVGPGLNDHMVANGLQQVSSMPEDSTIAEVAWTENKLVFSDEPFSEVIKKLARWYGVAIELQDASLARIPFSGTFRNESIHDVLGSLQFSSPFTYHEQNGKIIINK